jgi:hypothetical protein
MGKTLVRGLACMANENFEGHNHCSEAELVAPFHTISAFQIIRKLSQLS